MKHEVSVTITLNATRFVEAMRRASRATERLAQALRGLSASRPSRHPFANPDPLPIDGHAYRARRNRRKTR